MSEPDPKLLNLESALAETRRLREENARLQRLLQEHGIPIPGFPFTDGFLSQRTHHQVLVPLSGMQNNESLRASERG